MDDSSKARPGGTREAAPAYFLRFTGPHRRGLAGHASLEEARAAAWDMRRDSTSTPVEILDARMQVVLGRSELRRWLALQDRDWPDSD